MQERWEHFDHGADVGVRGLGLSKAGAFERAALALTAVIAEPGTVQARDDVPVACAAPDDEQRLVRWLNALLGEMALRRVVFGAFRVAIDGPNLRATASGEPLCASRHRPAVQVKGATFTATRVAQRADGAWIAQTVVDV